MSENLWQKVVRVVATAGAVPFPKDYDGIIIEILQNLINEEQARLLLHFKKPSLNMAQILERTEDEFKEKEVKRLLKELLAGGVLVKSQSRTTGIDVYRLLGPFPGMFEYTMMKGETGEKQKRIAHLFEKLFDEMTERTQKNYDAITSQFKKVRELPTARVVPVEKEVKVGEEEVIPGENIIKLLDDYELIALTNCYCRHEKELVDNPCKVTDEKLNCLLLGKGAKHAIEQGFAKPISKEETIKILRQAEKEALVHRVFHVHLDPKREIEAICNCCKCCCGGFELYHRGASPFFTSTSYLAKVNRDDCIGCGTCVEKCPMETIELVDTVAQINEDKCIGCGVCAHHCPEEAIHLQRTGHRFVFVPPIKLTAD